MKAYLLTSGSIFGLITLAHVLRVVAEGTDLLGDPWYLALTLAALALCLWAFRLLRALSRA
jgi:hypothetical protein